MSVTGRPDFYVLEAPEPEYAEQDEDPVWSVITLQPDGRRPVLRRLTNGDCYFLSPSGCGLTLEVRPLICRIHPYTYVENSLKGIDGECPIAQRPDAAFVLEQMGMPAAQAEAWRQQLYCELISDRSKDTIGLSVPTEPESSQPIV